MPSVLRAALLGAGLAAAWFLASVTLGSASASAAETETPTGGGLGAVIGAVVDDVGEISSVATDVLRAEPVAAVLEPTAGAVDSIAAPALERLPVIGDRMADAPGSGPVGAVVAPVTAVLDRTLGGTGRLADSAVDTVDAILAPVTGHTPLQPLLPQPGDDGAAAPSGPHADRAGTGDASVSGAPVHPGAALRVTTASSAAWPEPAGAESRAASEDPAHMPAPTSPAGPITSALGGPGSSSGGPHAVSLLAVALNRDLGGAPAHGRSDGALDSSLPSSIVYDTDSSPD